MNEDLELALKSAEDDIDEAIIKVIWNNVSLTRTQLKNRLLSELLAKANTNFDERISNLVKKGLIEDTEIETKLRVIKKK